ncbi:MAG TPA: hypothetical protein VKA48_09940 [Gammaproteobacteria bacterium]|nr:hypothetical protein [Gammaproteobacteria bacterium]
MIHLGTITTALTELLRKNPDLIDLQARVDEAEYANQNPDNTPWIGVYDARKVYDPRTLGRHSTAWQGQVNLTVVVQYASFKDGKDARDGLEKILEAVEAAITADVRLDGTVDRVTGLEVDYAFRREEFERAYFREGVITIEAEVATG